MEALLAQLLGHLLGIVQEAHADGDDDDLARRQPERPLAGKVLGENGREALDAAGHGAVDHDRSGAAGRKRLLDQEGLPLVLAILLVVVDSLWRRCGSGRGSRHHAVWPRLVLLVTLGRLVLQREIDRLLEVELDGGALPRSLWGVLVVGARGQREVILR